MGLYDKIVEYHNSTPQEEIDRVWALSEDYNSPEFGGITVGEFMEQLTERQKELEYEFKIKVMSFKDWFNNNLTVGGFPIMVNNRFNLSDFDIVINVSDEWYPDIEMQLQESFLKTYWFPMNECKSDIGLNSIYGAIIILRRAEERGLRVYLHCHAGVNRSRIVQAAYYFMRTGEQYNREYGGFVNSLTAACNRNLLPPKKSVEKFLLKLNDEIGKYQKYGGMLDLCKLNN